VNTYARRLGDFNKGKFCNGEKFSLRERKLQRTIRTEVSIQFFCTCTRVAMGEIAYVCELHWAQWHMYTSCSKVNHVHPYKGFWEEAGMYMLISTTIQSDMNNNIGDVDMSYMWSATNLWEEGISRDLLRFDFLIFLVIGGQGCP
jgi:hypothetical protein